MSKIKKVNFDEAYLRSSSGHFYMEIGSCCIFWLKTDSDKYPKHPETVNFGVPLFVLIFEGIYSSFKEPRKDEIKLTKYGKWSFRKSKRESRKLCWEIGIVRLEGETMEQWKE